MTRRRKILIGLVAALVLANIIAALHAARQVTDVLWVSGIDYDRFGPDLAIKYEGGILDDEWRQVVRLDRHGARRGVRYVPFTAMIDNVGETELERLRSNCLDDVHGTCVRSPWTARAIAEPDTPMGIIIAASNTVQAVCEVNVVVRTELDSHLSQFEEQDLRTDAGDFELFSSKLDMPLFMTLFERRTTFSHLMQQQGGETLAQFGQRSGCARISQLRP